MRSTACLRCPFVRGQAGKKSQDLEREGYAIKGKHAEQEVRRGLRGARH